MEVISTPRVVRVVTEHRFVNGTIEVILRPRVIRVVPVAGEGELVHEVGEAIQVLEQLRVLVHLVLEVET